MVLLVRFFVGLPGSWDTGAKARQSQVPRRDTGGANRPVETDKEGGYLPGVGADRRRRGRISWVAGTCYPSYYKKGESYFSRDRNRSWKEYIIYIARQEYKFRDHGSYYTVDVVTG